MTTPPVLTNNDPERNLRGASAVRYGIARYLKESYETVRNRCLNVWQMPGNDLPAIRKFSPFDHHQIANGLGPILGVEPISSSRYKVSDHNSFGSEEFRPMYSMRVTVWLYSPDDETGNPLSNARSLVIRQRDDQLAILKTALLARPSLNTDILTLQIDSLQEAYLTPTPVDNNSKRWLIAGQLSFDVQADEWVTVDAIGRVIGPGSIGVETEVLLKEDGPQFPNIDRLP